MFAPWQDDLSLKVTVWLPTSTCHRPRPTSHSPANLQKGFFLPVLPHLTLCLILIGSDEISHPLLGQSLAGGWLIQMSPSLGPSPPGTQPKETVQTYLPPCGLCPGGAWTPAQVLSARPRKSPNQLSLRFLCVGLKFCLILLYPWWSFLKLHIPRPTLEDFGLG